MAVPLVFPYEVLYVIASEKQGVPKRYLYFWGRWSPFTVRIFLWYYEKRTLNALGFWQKNNQSVDGWCFIFRVFA